MLTTLVLEFFLAGYTIWRYNMTTVTRLITLMLGCLATFQLAEYFVCTGYGGVHGPAWSQLGFVAIAALPPLGLHAQHILAGKPNRRLVQTSYAMMAAFMAAFLIFPEAFNSYQCTGNYVIFHLRPRLGGLYYIYYFGWLFTAISLGVRWANELKTQSPAERKKLETTQAMVLGYLVFLIPVTLANVVSPSTRAGIPSIMCGFAVLLALILGLYIMPRVGSKRLTNPLQKISAEPPLQR